MATSRATAAAVLGTVTDTANAISGVVNTVSNSLDMLNGFVRHQQAKQRLTQKVELNEFTTVLAERMALEEAERKSNIAQICQDPTKAEYYNAAYARIEALLSES